MYAPILLFVYNRPEHTRRVIESLQTNVEAIESRLFIYADQVRNEADRPNVDEVRRYIRSIGGFNRLHLSNAPRTGVLPATSSMESQRRSMPTDG